MYVENIYINSNLQPAAGPFGQSQLNNNPNTVLISSTANSLMSATVKPSSQPIGAIGTKGATPFQQNPLPSQHSQVIQLFVTKLYEFIILNVILVIQT